MTLEHWKLVADLAKTAIWPIAIIGLVFIFRKDLRALVPRLQKAGLSGVEFGSSRQEQGQERSNVDELGKLDNDSQELREIPGYPRTETIERVEKSILNHLKEFEETSKIPRLVRELAQAKLEAAFERLYSNIFGSQIAGLRRLVDEGGQVSVAMAHEFFNTVKAQYPEFYEKTTFDQWFSFIKNNGLADVMDGVVKITPMGQDFLLYLNAQRLREDKHW